MAICEKCGAKGLNPASMYIDMDNKMFVGECCKGLIPNTLQISPVGTYSVEDVEYGVSVTNKKGVFAFLRVGGLDITFNRTPQQIKEWAEKNGV